MTNDPSPILILGAGINGAAVARELVLNGLPVVVVDANDIACGATSRSSRLIHGGLRYLEHGDFSLVAESLRERAILLRTAPQFVRPLRLRIPIRRRFGGLMWSLFVLLNWQRTWMARFWLRQFPNARQRGWWLVRLGLTAYDWLARRMKNDDRPTRNDERNSAPRINPHSSLSVLRSSFAPEYRWACEYSDAQITFPERFVVALLEDARCLAAQRGVRFEVHTHTLAENDGHQVRLHGRIRETQPHVESLTPSIIINATGAWGDATLAALRVGSRRLFGGTKGSHFLTAQPELRHLLGDAGVYAEAADGRLVFVLPFDDQLTLVGTTDEPFDARPETAIAEPREVDYLIELVNSVLPSARLARDDVLLTYSGVRPLPFSQDAATAAIPRGHWIDENRRGPIPIFTMIGGKLTTCRALAEEVTERVLAQVDRPRVENSQTPLVPGAESFPQDDAAEKDRVAELSRKFGLSLSQTVAVWRLIGNRFDEFICENVAAADRVAIADTDLPRGFVQWVIRHEWVGSLSDLVERRLMLIYQPRLTVCCLHELAGLLADAGVIEREKVPCEVEATVERLQRVYQRGVVGAMETEAIV